MNTRSDKRGNSRFFILIFLIMTTKLPKTDVSEQIFTAIDRLMAKEGLHHLSMHKLAKEADIAAGTIYLYFKSKDELLAKFARRVFERFVQAMELDFDENADFFAQYRQMWRNTWQFLQENPTILSNINQYQSLPEFISVCREVHNTCWDKFVAAGQAAGELTDLPEDILFMLSLKTTINLASHMNLLESEISEEMIESVIERSWRAIQK